MTKFDRKRPARFLNLGTLIVVEGEAARFRIDAKAFVNQIIKPRTVRRANVGIERVGGGRGRRGVFFRHPIGFGDAAARCQNRSQKRSDKKPAHGFLRKNDAREKRNLVRLR